MAIQSIRAAQIQTGAVTFNKILSTDVETDLAVSASASKLAHALAIKTYVDNQTAAAVLGVKPKQAARVATASTIETLSGKTWIADGTGAPGAGEVIYNPTAKTITFDTAGPSAIDGITLGALNRILVKNETSNQYKNGIYVRTSSTVWTRATDFDQTTPIDEINGASVGVQEGTANAGKVFVQYGTVTTFDTDAILFTFYNSVSALSSGSTGIDVTGSVISLSLSGSTLTEDGTGLKVADGGITSTQLAVGAVDLSTSVVTGTLAATKGGTGFASYTVGDILYASSTTALSKLAIGAAGTVLKGGTTPSWAAVSLTADVSGVLPVANGGTNSSSALANDRVMISSGSAIVEAAAITASRALVSDGSGIPTHSATTATELGYVSGVTSAIQTQLNARKVLTYAFGTATTAGEITDTELSGSFDAYTAMIWIINGSVQTDTLTRDDSGNKFTSGNIIIGDIVAALIYP
jgi:hypothetical protein